jgi:tetratricopeptide (TPR) repeat protein
VIARNPVEALAGVWVLIAVAAPSAGCGRAAPSAPAGEATARAAPRPRTTDGELATHNFEAELAQAERQWNARPSDVGRGRALIEHLLAHAHFFGRLADYDRAAEVGEHVVALSPASAGARALRARVEAALHRFPQALSDLDAAERLGADPDVVLRGRVGVWQALGQVDRALGYLRAWRRDRPDLLAYAAEASALADKRELPRAAALFAEAERDHYSDVSPFAVAWVEFQEGHVWESAGRADLAQPLFESALARLPGYTSAGAHLARLAAAFGDLAGTSRAAALLEGIVARSDDPEYLGQLGALYRQMGRANDGDRLIGRATERYEDLLRRHPEAFYDHAARFFLHVAGDPIRARALAEKNLSLRPSADARDLYDETQRAAALTTGSDPTRSF